MGFGRRYGFGAVFAVLGMLWSPTALSDAPLRAPIAPERPVLVEPVDPTNGIELRTLYPHTGRSGWQLVDLATGEVLDAHEPDRSFAPASVAKLPTALFALDTLGPEHRFVTRLSKTGRIADGVLAGDLYLIGGGDPELDTDGLAELVADLAAFGIREVDGRFIVSESGAVRAEEIDPDQPGDMAFNPAVSGLNLNYNRVRLRWGRSAGSAGLTVSALAERLDPLVEQVEVRSAGGGAPLFAHAEIEGREVWTFNARALRGTGSRWLPVRGPELYAGDVFRQLATDQGVVLPPAIEGALDPSARVLAQRTSRPLSEILRDMLRFSTNLTAEVVGAASSREASGASIGSLEQSAALMNGWVAHSAGFSPGDPRIRFVNHSGLTDLSRVAPSRLVGLLAQRDPRIDAMRELLSAYAVANADDPLDALPEVFAKTGTMDRIRGLAGYITMPAGRQLAFAIFSNDLAGRVATRRGISSGWMGQARAFERALIRQWVRRFDG
ncbi:MAG: D-alanyl-D-alanine carboxypeptidase/D-alanyl-D-alanine-endopeptidase [Pseudomonadota bacterium]